MHRQWLQRTAARPVAVARPTGQAGVRGDHMAWRQRSKTEFRHRRTEDRHRWRAHGGRQVLRGRIVGDEYAAAAEERRGGERCQSTGRIDDAGAVGAGRGHDLCGVGLLGTCADDDDAPIRAVVRP